MTPTRVGYFFMGLKVPIVNPTQGLFKRLWGRIAYPATLITRIPPEYGVAVISTPALPSSIKLSGSSLDPETWDAPPYTNSP